jgi:hypothetical protein
MYSMIVLIMRALRLGVLSMRKQIGLRMKDETRDQLERVRGGLSRTDYIEGAVLAQIARDLKKVETPHEYSLDTGTPVDIIEDDRMPPNMAVAVPSGEVFVNGEQVEVNKPSLCGRIMVGSGTDSYDPVCVLASGHLGSCKSPTAIDHRRIVVSENLEYNPKGHVRSSAESKSGVLPVPKKAVKGRK